MTERNSRPCPYQSSWHNHPELPRHGEAVSEAPPEPETESEP